uniref:Uncharacterized protein n=1 Tax=Noctiluca scintillans TaxID=2966 RepID=A0A7S1AE96_NOCSC|mmetsp:Transcript_4158/g.11731  ORF Transcript_4158/g.11731 Transcript_4158/m.11731 type:complete len:418 (+) Transcript_4158:54-1307(+)|eukprot:CAMPEP_0194508640 /NCGR_PEP_ID=MMETSP0253-20130528/39034_1 /TAXON_ID=2966 /ORGANISM="Noctiluca scintillans" /LENGTH=417 /DNA_ID=CAMNT_0039351705 /DNA_START=39 /DNA_END=1292 /DNA_ORIENTATION=+
MSVEQDVEVEQVSWHQGKNKVPTSWDQGESVTEGNGEDSLSAVGSASTVASTASTCEFTESQTTDGRRSSSSGTATDRRDTKVSTTATPSFQPPGGSDVFPVVGAVLEEVAALRTMCSCMCDSMSELRESFAALSKENREVLQQQSETRAALGRLQVIKEHPVGHDPGPSDKQQSVASKGNLKEVQFHARFAPHSQVVCERPSRSRGNVEERSPNEMDIVTRSKAALARMHVLEERLAGYEPGPSDKPQRVAEKEDNLKEVESDAFFVPLSQVVSGALARVMGNDDQQSQQKLDAVMHRKVACEYADQRACSTDANFDRKRGPQRKGEQEVLCKLLRMRLAAKERDSDLSGTHVDAALHGPNERKDNVQSFVAKRELRYSPNAILEIMKVQLRQKLAVKLREVAAIAPLFQLIPVLW